MVSGVVKEYLCDVKIQHQKVSRVIRAMESEESERFLFLRAPLMTPSLRSAYDLVKTRLSESEAEVERKFYHNISSHAS